eukprot:Lithocolla_globosa_v1_NODE_501_length_3886_cov_9.491778.p2 type:complete len:134 gc:universal NODE_501_length_3886_cov_9.491778:1315-914(-)
MAFRQIIKCIGRADALREGNFIFVELLCEYVAVRRKIIPQKLEKATHKFFFVRCHLSACISFYQQLSLKHTRDHQSHVISKKTTDFLIGHRIKGRMPAALLFCRRFTNVPQAYHLPQAIFRSFRPKTPETLPF